MQVKFRREGAPDQEDVWGKDAPDRRESQGKVPGWRISLLLVFASTKTFSYHSVLVSAWENPLKRGKPYFGSRFKRF